jgi:hypothetical protein
MKPNLTEACPSNFIFVFTEEILSTRLKGLIMILVQNCLTVYAWLMRWKPIKLIQHKSKFELAIGIMAATIIT